MSNDKNSKKESWDEFKSMNHFRRAIRKFKSTPISESEMNELLAEAIFAPSSGNLQPYRLHWVKNDSLKKSIAQACNGQRAAVSAAELIVIEASPEIGRNTADMQLKYTQESPSLDEKSKSYHRKNIGKFQKIIGIGASSVWSPLVFFAALIRPSLALLPIGHIGSKHWAARNSIFTAQTLMLAVAAREIDSCPMEGFSGAKIVKLLGLPRSSVVSLVIALGYRSDDARVEDRWRRPASESIILHE
jgi:nitroreductase